MNPNHPVTKTSKLGLVKSGKMQIHLTPACEPETDYDANTPKY